MSDEPMTLLDFSEVRCDRKRFSLRKRPLSARRDWCSWCRCILAGNEPCPVKSALTAAREEQ